jgi:mono/diheme cytochrome c family protein
MQVQARPNTFRPSPVFADGRVMRPAVKDTVSQEAQRASAGLLDARLPDGGWVDALPMPLTRALVDEGHQRFDVICATCHGLLANGQTVVARKMTLRPPPNLLVPKWSGAEAPPGQLPRPLGFYVDVMSHGYGLMPSYADMLEPRERWAVVSYLEALALSQRAPVASLPEDLRERLEAMPR